MEKQFEAKLRKKILLLGGLCFKWVSPGTRGMPDRIILMPFARVYFVETKTPTGRLSPAQKLIHSMIRALGFKVYTIYTEEELKKFLDEIQTT